MKEKTGQKPIRCEVFKETKEDWYPAYKIEHDLRYEGFVMVAFLELVPSGEWRVCIWGQDDYGLERDFPPHERMKAWEVFVDIISAEYVTHDLAKKWRMYGA